VTDEHDPRLAALLAALAAPGEEPPPAVVARTLAAARSELRAGFAPGFWRELLRLAAPAAAALPVVLALDAAVAWTAWLALSGWLPRELAALLPALFVFGAAGWLALFFGALPVLAHRLTLRRLQEVPS
jgi:hypothetical protein